LGEEQGTTGLTDGGKGKAKAKPREKKKKEKGKQGIGNCPYHITNTLGQQREEHSERTAGFTGRWA